MKRKIALLITASLLLAGCNTAKESTSSADDSVPAATAAPAATGSQDGTAETGELAEEWMRLQILNATETPNEVYYKRDVYTCGEGADPGNYSTLIDKDKLDYIVSYVEKSADSCVAIRDTGERILDPKSYEGKTYLGYVEMSYVAKDADGNPIGSKYYKLEFFDAYPVEYQEFIDVVNKVMSGEELILGEPMEMSSDLFKSLTGYTDDMVTDGTLEDVLDLYPCDVYSLMNSYADNYLYERNDNIETPDMYMYWPLFRALPREIRSEESTDEEYQKFAEDLAVRLGEDPSDVSKSSNGYLYIANQPFAVVRSNDLPAWFDYEGMPLYLISREVLDGGELVKDDIRTFFYSSDGKFIVMFTGSYMRSWYGDQMDYDYFLNFYTTCSDLLE